MKLLSQKITSLILTIVLLISMMAMPVSASTFAKSYNPILNNLREQHPRLFIKSFNQFRDKIDNDERAAKWYTMIKEYADDFLTKDLVQYIPNNTSTTGPMLIKTARPFFERVYTLALVYKMENDKKYLDRLWKEVETVSNFPDWDPVSYLSIAEFLHGMAISYDWLFYDWSDEQRDIILQAIKDKGLNIGVKNLNGILTGINWTTADNNWAFVCNGGNTMAALAIADEEPKLAEFIIEKSIEKVKAALPPYAPDGGFREGSNYWGYATNYLTYYMSALETAVKDGFKLPEKYDLSLAPGVSQTSEYAIYITGPTAAFNYGDSIPEKIFSPALYWFANKFKKPSYAYYQAQYTDKYKTLKYAQPLVVDLMWYDPENCYLEDDFALDRKFENTADVLLRSSFDDNALFVGMKGGSNQAPHGFLSVGSFAIDALGQRWARGSVMGNYSWPGYFGSVERYKYYVGSAEGNNCLVFNPSTALTQNPLADSKVIKFESAKSNAFGVIDMTSAYSTHIKSAKRGVKIFDNRTKIVIQDEIMSDNYNEVWWFMQSSADPEFSLDGKSVILNKNGKQMVAKIASPKEATFMQMDAKPLPNSVYLSGQTADYGSKLAIQMENMKDFTLTVEFEPVYEGEKPNLTPSAVVPLKDWKALDSEDINENLNSKEDKIRASILIDGKPFEAFSPFEKYYFYTTSQNKIPFITASSANANVDVRVMNARSQNGTACVSFKENGKESKYYISFLVDEKKETSLLKKLSVSLNQKNEIITNYISIKNVTVTASESSDVTGGNMLDNNQATRWGVADTQSAIFEFENPSSLYAAGVAVYSGNMRVQYFDLEASKDGVNWSGFFNGGSSAKTLFPEIYEAKLDDIMYVRLNCYGNSSSNMNGFTEIRFYDKKEQLEADKLSWEDVFNPKKVANIFQTGEQIKVYAQGLLENGKVVDLPPKSLTYSISNSKVASVSEDGVITTNSKGDFYLIVTSKTGFVYRIERVLITVK